MKIEKQWIGLFLLGIVSNALFFGIYMWFGLFLLVALALASLHRFLNEGPKSIKQLGGMFSFVSGATCGWIAMYIFWL